ncbi:MAG: PKD domain-containing protein [bacterium]|nr:PKD domain-containing protein [bacterium]
MALIVAWHWDFDDGTTSAEKNPDHLFLMAGTFDVILTRTDVNGNTYQSSFRIRVYDYDYTGDNPNASITDKCYRLPVRPGDGFGPSEYKDSLNPGFDWLWPSARKGTALGYDENSKEICLVLDAKTQRIYRINDPDIWTDRTGRNYAEGNLLITEVHQKAHEAVNGEHIAIVHTETHDYFHPFDRDKAATEGYDAEGFPLEMRVDHSMVKDNEILPAKETVKIPKDGDIVYPQKLEARHLQQRVKIYHAPWLLSGINTDYETIDKAARPSLRVMTEMEYQENLSSLPLFHVSRNFFPLLNRATGEDANGTYILMTGPDDRDFSAINMRDRTGLWDTLAVSLRGDFTLMSWFNNTISLPMRLWNIGALEVDLRPGYIIRIRDGVNPDIVQQLNVYRGTNWAHIAVTRNNLIWNIYENGTFLGRFEMNEILDYGTACYCVGIG